MNLVRWDPIREMDQFFARPFGSFMGQWPRLAAQSDDAESAWAPMLDVSETDSEYLVRADLPAVKKRTSVSRLTMTWLPSLASESSTRKRRARKCTAGSAFGARSPAAFPYPMTPMRAASVRKARTAS